jgi:signal transduction histidine kinase
VRLRRPLLVFGALLCVPAAVLASLGWRSLEREHAARRGEARRAAEGVAERVVLEQADALERLRRAEDARPYFHYAAQFQPAEIATNVAAFVPSPLSKGADDRRLVGWFQRALFASERVSPLEAFGPAADRLAAEVEAAYGDALTERLRGAARARALPGANVVPTPLAAVAADEEKGQLLEEIDVAARKGESSTRRLDDYRKRVQTAVADRAATVDVRTTPFAYLARAEDAPGPPLVAYRVVWIPAQEGWQSRDVPTDRWLVQGYALDPGRELPATWTAAGDDVLVVRGDAADPAAARRPASRSLADVLRAEVVAPSAPPPAQVAFLQMESQGQWEGPASPLPVQGVPARQAGAPALAGPPPPPAASEGTVARVGFPAPALDASPPAPALVADASLAVLAVPAEADIASSFAAARNRFLLLVLGLAAVVAVGFGTLLRSVRREVALARRKEDFVAAVTHELKTPLAGIRMYADMLRGGFFDDPDAAGAYAGRIVGEAKRLDALVDRVLSLAAWDRGVAAFRPVPGDLGAVAREAVEALAERAREDGTDLRLEVEPGLPAVSFDPALALPMLTNLVDNAVKYSARAPVREVVVRVARDGEGVAVSVADRGPGIPPDDLPRVFEPFHRAGREDTRQAPGVGLGLALVRRYADAHGAEVALESAPGRGTTVTVRFRA